MGICAVYKHARRRPTWESLPHFRRYRLTVESRVRPPELFIWFISFAKARTRSAGAVLPCGSISKNWHPAIPASARNGNAYRLRYTVHHNARLVSAPMSSTIPSRASCLHAARRLRMQRYRAVRVYLFQLWSPLVRGKRRTTGSYSPEEVGALLIAADDSIRDVNAALLRASVLLEQFVPLPEGPSFSELVKDRALLMLRCGWRRRDDEVARECAELAALRTRLVWWSEETI